MVMWECVPGVIVTVTRDDAQMLQDLGEAFDSIMFVWTREDGYYQFVYMPRPPDRPN